MCVIAYQQTLNQHCKKIQYSSNFKYIIIVHLIHHIVLYINLLQRRKIQNRREHLATPGYVTLSVTVIYLLRIKRFLHLSLGCDHHHVPCSSYNTAAVNGDGQRFPHLSLSYHLYNLQVETSSV
jgi:hypothetical protein